MLRVNLRDAKPGMVLAMPARHPAAVNLVLLKIDYQLDTASITRLREIGVRMVWVRYPALNCLEKFISPVVIETHGELIREVAATFESVQNKASAKTGYDIYTTAMGRLINALVSNPQAAMFLGGLGESDSDGDAANLMRHSAVVTYVSLLMGLKLSGFLVRQRRHIDPGRASQVTSLGVGAMLHDIGTIHLPEAVQELYRQTGNDQDPQWQEHPFLGYQGVRGQIEPSAATIVLNHHQRTDGSGYAGGNMPVLAGDRIHVFARIAALADAFDELQFPVNQPERPTAQVLRYLVQPRRAQQFDAPVLLALLAVVPPFAPGSILRLSDGQWAVAIDHNVDQPCRPTVQLIPDPHCLSADDDEDRDIIDLSSCAETLKVVECDGAEVGQFSFDVPASLRPEAAAANWA